MQPFRASLDDIFQHRNNSLLPTGEMRVSQQSHLQQQLQWSHGSVRFQNSVGSQLYPFLKIPRLFDSHKTLKHIFRNRERFPILPEHKRVRKKNFQGNRGHPLFQGESWTPTVSEFDEKMGVRAPG
jgi:hypothetical protein